MSIYRPTWLYIKQHNVTRLKYIGITTSTDPVKYPGSGTYWKSHIKKHGNNVTTIWCSFYTEELDLIADATAFSHYHDIVNSSDWANLIPERGAEGGGGVKGHIISPETKEKIGAKARGRKMSPEFCEMRSKIQTGKIPGNKGIKGVYVGHNKGKKFGPLSDERKLEISLSLKGKKKGPMSDEHKLKLSISKRGNPGTPHNDTAKSKISTAATGRRAMHNTALGIAIKMISEHQIVEYIRNGWLFNSKKKGDEIIIATATKPNI